MRSGTRGQRSREQSFTNVCLLGDGGERPDAVVVDIYLESSPSFQLTEALRDRGIPFVFTTGYDAGAILAESEGVERLEKPLQLGQIVGPVARLTTTT